jgi:hypothetical protein
MRFKIINKVSINTSEGKYKRKEKIVKYGLWLIPIKKTNERVHPSFARLMLRIAY